MYMYMGWVSVVGSHPWANFFGFSGFLPSKPTLQILIQSHNWYVSTISRPCRPVLEAKYTLVALFIVIVKLQMQLLVTV